MLQALAESNQARADKFLTDATQQKQAFDQELCVAQVRFPVCDICRAYLCAQAIWVGLEFLDSPPHMTMAPS